MQRDRPLSITEHLQISGVWNTGTIHLFNWFQSKAFGCREFASLAVSVLLS